MVSIGGVEVGNLTDAKTLPGILRAITNKARKTANSGGSMSSFNNKNKEEK